jgi:putative multiple sugar transport system permease protein
MAVLNNGIQLNGWGTEIGKVVKGLVLLLAVTLDVMNKVQGKPSLIGRLMDGLRPKHQVDDSIVDDPSVADDPAPVGAAAQRTEDKPTNQ